MNTTTTLRSCYQIAETSKRYSEVESLKGVILLIARCKAVIETEINISQLVSIGDSTGVRLGNQSRVEIIEKYTMIIARLYRYYNSKLESLTKFKI